MSEFTTAVYAARAERLGLTVVSALTGGLRDVWNTDDDAWAVTLECHGKRATFLCCSGDEIPTAGQALEDVMTDIRMADYEALIPRDERILTTPAAAYVRREKRDLRRLIGAAAYDALVDLYYGAWALSDEVIALTS